MSDGFVRPRGGSEILYENLFAHVDASYFDGVNLLLNKASLDALQKDKINILWCHVDVSSPAMAVLESRELLEALDYIVFVSHWQFERYCEVFRVPERKCVILKNACPLIPLVEKPKDRLRLVYASTPFRGLDILLEAFERLDRDDVELDVFSSTIIYGSHFYKTYEANYASLFERAKTLKNVHYHGFADNKTIHTALQRAHIFVYPSTFQETSCLAAIEAAMAGCALVTTNFGALYETLGEWGHFVPYFYEREHLTSAYTKKLDWVMENFWQDEMQEKLTEQSRYYSRFYTWEKRAQEWMDFLSSIKK